MLLHTHVQCAALPRGLRARDDGEGRGDHLHVPPGAEGHARQNSRRGAATQPCASLPLPKPARACVCVQVCALSTGLPVGVQVATLPFQDELALRVMKLLQDNLPKEE